MSLLKCLIGLAGLASLVVAHEPFIVKFQWNFINYTWPNEEAYSRASKDDSYIEENNVISDVKLWNGRMYLSIPRWKLGVPVTLASTSATPVNGQTAPKLEPFPSWDMQKIGDCSAFQFVQGMEVDPQGRLWVLDSGRSATLTLEAKASCSPRLVILDLERNGTILSSYNFPEDVASPESAYLNDIVLDHEDGTMAYISDSDEKNPGIIVFSLQNETAWKVSDPSMFAKSSAVDFKIDQTRVSNAFHVDGLALSPALTEGNRTLYYTPLSSFSIFSVPTRALKDESLKLNISGQVRVVGRKPSQTDGMTMSNTGIMYFGLLADDAVSMWNSINLTFGTGQRIISRDHHLMQWPSSFAFDERGQLWCITNRLHLFLEDSLNIETPNFRAIVARVNMSSYQFYENGTAPELAEISAASRADFALASLLALLLLLLSQ